MSCSLAAGLRMKTRQLQNLPAGLKPALRLMSLLLLRQKRTRRQLRMRRFQKGSRTERLPVISQLNQAAMRLRQALMMHFRQRRCQNLPCVRQRMMLGSLGRIRQMPMRSHQTLGKARHPRMQDRTVLFCQRMTRQKNPALTSLSKAPPSPAASPSFTLTGRESRSSASPTRRSTRL